MHVNWIHWLVVDGFAMSWNIFFSFYSYNKITLPLIAACRCFNKITLEHKREWGTNNIDFWRSKRRHINIKYRMYIYIFSKTFIWDKIICSLLGHRFIKKIDFRQVKSSWHSLKSYKCNKFILLHWWCVRKVGRCQMLGKYLSSVFGGEFPTHLLWNDQIAISCWRKTYLRYVNRKVYHIF